MTFDPSGVHPGRVGTLALLFALGATGDDHALRALKHLKHKNIPTENRALLADIPSALAATEDPDA